MMSSKKTFVTTFSGLIHFEAAVDVADKSEGRPKRHAAQHQREDQRREQGVSEELRALHQPAHGRPVPVVENRVDEDEETRRTGAEDAPPPPLVVLARQQEVGQGHGDASSH